LPIYQNALEDTRKEDESAEDEFTTEELAAIRSLKRLAHKWPKTLMLLSLEGGLYVIHTADQGAIATSIDGAPDVPRVQIDGITNDGGAW
jgi:hypothetical protein